ANRQGVYNWAPKSISGSGHLRHEIVRKKTARANRMITPVGSTQRERARIDAAPLTIAALRLWAWSRPTVKFPSGEHARLGRGRWRLAIASFSKIVAARRCNPRPRRARSPDFTDFPR